MKYVVLISFFLFFSFFLSSSSAQDVTPLQEGIIINDTMSYNYKYFNTYTIEVQQPAPNEIAVLRVGLTAHSGTPRLAVLSPANSSGEFIWGSNFSTTAFNLTIDPKNPGSCTLPCNYTIMVSNEGLATTYSLYATTKENSTNSFVLLDDTHTFAPHVGIVSANQTAYFQHESNLTYASVSGLRIVVSPFFGTVSILVNAYSDSSFNTSLPFPTPSFSHFNSSGFGFDTSVVVLQPSDFARYCPGSTGVCHLRIAIYSVFSVDTEFLITLSPYISNPSNITIPLPIGAPVFTILHQPTQPLIPFVDWQFYEIVSLPNPDVPTITTIHLTPLWGYVRMLVGQNQFPNPNVPGSVFFDSEVDGADVFGAADGPTTTTYYAVVVCFSNCSFTLLHHQHINMATDNYNIIRLLNGIPQTDFCDAGVTKRVFSHHTTFDDSLSMTASRRHGDIRIYQGYPHNVYDIPDGIKNSWFRWEDHGLLAGNTGLYQIPAAPYLTTVNCSSVSEYTITYTSGATPQLLQFNTPLPGALYLNESIEVYNQTYIFYVPYPTNLSLPAVFQRDLVITLTSLSGHASISATYNGRTYFSNNQRMDAVIIPYTDLLTATDVVITVYSQSPVTYILLASANIPVRETLGMPLNGYLQASGQTQVYEQYINYAERKLGNLSIAVTPFRGAVSLCAVVGNSLSPSLWNGSFTWDMCTYKSMYNDTGLPTHIMHIDFTDPFNACNLEVFAGMCRVNILVYAESEVRYTIITGQPYHVNLLQQGIPIYGFISPDGVPSIASFHVPSSDTNVSLSISVWNYGTQSASHSFVVSRDPLYMSRGTTFSSENPQNPTVFIDGDDPKFNVSFHEFGAYYVVITGSPYTTFTLALTLNDNVWNRQANVLGRANSTGITLLHGMPQRFSTESYNNRYQLLQFEIPLDAATDASPHLSWTQQYGSSTLGAQFFITYNGTVPSPTNYYTMTDLSSESDFALTNIPYDKCIRPSVTAPTYCSLLISAYPDQSVFSDTNYTYSILDVTIIAHSQSVEILTDSHFTSGQVSGTDVRRYTSVISSDAASTFIATLQVHTGSCKFGYEFGNSTFGSPQWIAKFDGVNSQLQHPTENVIGQTVTLYVTADLSSPACTFDVAISSKDRNTFVLPSVGDSFFLMQNSIPSFSFRIPFTSYTNETFVFEFSPDNFANCSIYATNNGTADSSNNLFHSDSSSPNYIIRVGADDPHYLSQAEFDILIVPIHPTETPFSVHSLVIGPDDTEITLNDGIVHDGFVPTSGGIHPPIFFVFDAASLASTAELTFSISRWTGSAVAYLVNALTHPSPTTRNALVLNVTSVSSATISVSLSQYPNSKWSIGLYASGDDTFQYSLVASSGMITLPPGQSIASVCTSSDYLNTKHTVYRFTLPSQPSPLSVLMKPTTPTGFFSYSDPFFFTISTEANFTNAVVLNNTLRWNNSLFIDFQFTPTIQACIIEAQVNGGLCTLFWKIDCPTATQSIGYSLTAVLGNQVSVLSQDSYYMGKLLPGDSNYFHLLFNNISSSSLIIRAEPCYGNAFLYYNDKLFPGPGQGNFIQSATYSNFINQITIVAPNYNSSYYLNVAAQPFAVPFPDPIPIDYQIFAYSDADELPSFLLVSRPTLNTPPTDAAGAINVRFYPVDHLFELPPGYDILYSLYYSIDLNVALFTRCGIDLVEQYEQPPISYKQSQLQPDSDGYYSIGVTGLDTSHTHQVVITALLLNTTGDPVYGVISTGIGNIRAWSGTTFFNPSSVNPSSGGRGGGGHSDTAEIVAMVTVPLVVLLLGALLYYYLKVRRLQNDITVELPDVEQPSKATSRKSGRSKRGDRYSTLLDDDRTI